MLTEYALKVQRKFAQKYAKNFALNHQYFGLLK